MKTLSAILLLLCASSCVSATVSDTVSATETLTLPGSPLGAGLGTTTYDTIVPVDVHSALSDLQKEGTISVSVLQNTLTATVDLGFVQSVSVTIQPQDGSLPALTLSQYTSTGGGNTINLPLTLDTGTITTYLAEGGTNLHFYFTGTIPPADVPLTYTLGASVSDSVKKSL